MFQNTLRQLIEEPKKLYFWTFLLSTMPFLHWFGILLVTLVTLRKGWKEGLVLTGIAIIAGLMLSIFVLGSNPGSVHSYVQAANIILLWLLAGILFQTASWKNVFTVAALVGVVIIGSIHVTEPNIVTFWINSLTKATNTPDLMPSFLSKEMTPDQVKVYIDYLSQIMTGMQVLASLSFSIISLAVARYMQASLYNPGGFKAEFYAWHLDRISGGIMAVLLVLALITQQAILIDCVPVLIFPAVCVGLSLAYYFSARYPYQTWILLAFYVLFFVFFPQVITLLTTLGFLDIVVNFRQRFLQKR